MNIHFRAILMFTRVTRFWAIPIYPQNMSHDTVPLWKRVLKFPLLVVTLFSLSLGHTTNCTMLNHADSWTPPRIALSQGMYPAVAGKIPPGLLHHLLLGTWSPKFTWLVVSAILKNISQWEGLSHILWKIKNVWNHQPDKFSICDISDIPSFQLTVWRPLAMGHAHRVAENSSSTKHPNIYHTPRIQKP